MNDYAEKLHSLRTFVNWVSGVQLALTGLSVTSTIAVLLWMIKLLVEGRLNVTEIFGLAHLIF